MQKAISKKNKIHDENLIKHDSRELIRLNKYISDSGFCSRREADRYILEERVKINGKLALVGSKVSINDLVTVDNKKISNNSSRVYIMLHKPTGITCTNDLKIKDNIRSYLNYHELVFTIGRLDKDSSGLILLTNDGDIVNKLLRSEFGHEKEYIVTVDQDITDDFIFRMGNGVLIYNQVSKKNQVTKKCHVEKLDKRTFRIILKQGLNRQIRRMTEELGYNVKSLKRIRVANIRIGDLKVGEWRYLNNKELEVLNELINRTK